MSTADLFLMFCDSHKPFAPGELDRILGTPHPTMFTRASQEQLAEVLEETPRSELTPDDIEVLCTRFSPQISDEAARIAELKRNRFRIPHEL